MIWSYDSIIFVVILLFFMSKLFWYSKKNPKNSKFILIIHIIWGMDEGMVEKLFQKYLNFNYKKDIKKLIHEYTGYM